MRNPFRRQRTEKDVEKRAYDPAAVPPAGASVEGGAPYLSVESATRLAPVFAAGRVLASSVSSLPIQVFRKAADGSRLQLPLPDLLVRPSVVGTLRDWLFRAVTSMAYQGNAVGVVTARDDLEYATGIEWLNPADVTVEDMLQVEGRGSFTQPVWFFRGEEIPREDIVHIPWFTLPFRVWGLSPMGAFATSVSTGLAAERFSHDWFRNGGVPPATFHNEMKEVDQREATIIKQRVVQAVRSHEPIVYGKDWKFEPITVSPHEAQFVETMRLTATQIASVYGIPPEMLGGETGDSMTYANEEQHDIRFLRFTLLPWLTTLESHLSNLLPRGQYVKFNVDALIRPDTQTRYASHQIARSIGLMSVDEIRALEDLEPLPGAAGDDHTPLQVQVKQAGIPAPAEGRGLTPADFGVTVLNERASNELEHYWKHGEGAAKVRWGTPGDWTRCHRHLEKHVGSERAKRICAQWHHDMTGVWPGDKANP